VIDGYEYEMEHDDEEEEMEMEEVQQKATTVCTPYPSF
jgi:hypothetical protein